ncbi:hypothetical protein TVAG_469240 [Trichomonas vaginalis G3]|uniref:Uncharacterized protein n=1 Tax=Trichomonas vaginalis (strain ATCC PRA-98 / G3) TaxID=412133 RepID=A2G4X3_TRIV3|nr:hypothetical protein TVAGG3_0433670 [Trichomonas vaginalis G3]EAX87789.1 hypothetical protein TVAG_469240 [Trichomonas vaginalis G3]KAI5536936.1 hypothetical protein TVAGG3_0433670 [Trichomonas vaginalis G3]|eukprot:XP_001300719.1 hypothetical protein [Trichomonas vaginalis G3]
MKRKILEDKDFIIFDYNNKTYYEGTQFINVSGEFITYGNSKLFYIKEYNESKNPEGAEYFLNETTLSDHEYRRHFSVNISIQNYTIGNYSIYFRCIKYQDNEEVYSHFEYFNFTIERVVRIEIDPLQKHQFKQRIDMQFKVNVSFNYYVDKIFEISYRINRTENINSLINIKENISLALETEFREFTFDISKLEVGEYYFKISTINVEVQSQKFVLEKNQQKVIRLII